LPKVSFNEGFYELKYSFDTLDNVYFPTPAKTSA
jgi:NTE family protein